MIDWLYIRACLIGSGCYIDGFFAVCSSDVVVNWCALNSKRMCNYFSWFAGDGKVRPLSASYTCMWLVSVYCTSSDTVNVLCYQVRFKKCGRFCERIHCPFSMYNMIYGLDHEARTQLDITSCLTGKKCTSADRIRFWVDLEICIIVLKTS